MIDSENIDQWLTQGREQFDQVREHAAEADTKVRSFAHEQPLLALACAAAGGYFLARLASMRLR